MVLLDLFVCDEEGVWIQGGEQWSVAFEVPPRVGETVRYDEAKFRVAWVSHEYDSADPIQDGYQLRVGIVETEP